MSIDWQVVERRHIEEACRLYDQGHDMPTAEARNTFLLLNGRRYPAKHIRGLAYRLATGHSLDPSRDYSGGMETVRFLNRLEFEVEYKARIYARHPRPEVLRAPPKQMHEASPHKRVPDPQKVALGRLLEQLFGDVAVEQKFDWLVVPNRAEMDSQLMAVVDALASYRGYADFYSPGERLKVDFFVSSQNLIIEYDERQHFTIPRAISLRQYPRDPRIGFDSARWTALCEQIRAVDRDPVDRDEARAFYDTLRDVLASRHDMLVVRIKDGDFDWTKPAGQAKLASMLAQIGNTNAVAPASEHAREASLTVVTADDERRSEVRIVTVCVRGECLHSVAGNQEREDLLMTATRAIERRGWANLDAVLLPGGFFFLDRFIGQLSFRERAIALGEAPFERTCRSVCNTLSAASPGMLLVTGVDTEEPAGTSPTWLGDQLCVGYSGAGVVGIGRKVFPTNGESTEYICYQADYDTRSRVVPLPSGRRAILCACYDMFGCAETPEAPTSRTSNIRYVSTGGPPLQATRADRHRFVERFGQLLSDQNVDVGLAAIHEFSEQGTEGGGIVNWQRHGIASCSAALGGLAAAAAHFTVGLPEPMSLTLAAADVPRTHLTAGHNRKANWMQPSDWLATDEGLLIRLFQK